MTKGLKYYELKTAMTELEFDLFQSHELLDFFHLEIHTNGVLPLESPISGSNLKGCIASAGNSHQVESHVGVNIFFPILY